MSETCIPIPRVVILDTELERIENETMKYHNRETGGILVGRKIPDGPFGTIVIVGATGPGPGADHKAHTYSYDLEYVGKKRDEYCQLFEGVDFVGEWHKHLGYWAVPSPSDLRQAMDIIADKDYRVTELIIPITVNGGARVEVFPYYINRSICKFVPIEWKSVSRSVSRIDQLVQQRRSADNWKHAWNETIRGQRRRIKERLLLGGLSVEVDMQRLRDGRIRFIVSKLNEDSVEIFKLYMNCPPDYPHTPPEIAVTKPNMKFDSQVVKEWHEDKFLRDIVVELQVIVPHQQHDETKHRFALGFLSPLTNRLLRSWRWVVKEVLQNV